MEKSENIKPTFSKRKVLRVAAYVLLIAAGTGFVALIARASFVKFYPGNCTGSWTNSQIVQQNRPPEDQGSLPAIDETNSAVYSGGVGNGVVCNNFNGDDFSGKILSVKLNLLWSFKSSHDVINVEVPAAATSTGSVPPSAAPIPQPQEILESTSTEPAPPANMNGTEPSSLPVSAPDAPPLATSTGADATTSAPSLTPPTPPQEPSAPAPTSTPSAWLRNLIPIANAEDLPGAPVVTASLAFDGLEHFLDVQYSTDGTDWHSIDNAGLEIPLTSLEDIKNTQIRIVNLRDGTDLPRIYLYAMWLEAKYVPDEAPATQVNATSTDANATTTDIAAPDASSTPSDGSASLLDNLTEMASNIGQAITDAVTPAENSPQVSEVAPAAESQPAQPSEPEISFIAPGAEDTSFLAALSKIVASPTDTTLTASPDGKTLAINGKCTSDYYTLLVFQDKNDFKTDPTRAIVNRAEPCAGGSYSLTLTGGDLPPTLIGGNYYLIIADQKEKKSPEPKAAYNIQINKSIQQ